MVGHDRRADPAAADVALEGLWAHVASLRIRLRRFLLQRIVCQQAALALPGYGCPARLRVRAA
jgi:hypothetical protein